MCYVLEKWARQQSAVQVNDEQLRGAVTKAGKIARSRILAHLANGA